MPEMSEQFKSNPNKTIILTTYFFRGGGVEKKFLEGGLIFFN